jgi:transposase
MVFYVGLDYSKLSTSICVLNEDGLLAEEGATESTPKAITAFLRGQRRRYALMGLEASTPAWLLEGLLKAKFRAVLIETWRAHAILQTTTNKTDRNDARGIAELMRIGAYRPVHAKSTESRRLRLMLVARSHLKRKQLDVEKGLSAALREYGLMLERGGRLSFAARAKALAQRNPDLQPLLELFLHAREVLAEGAQAIEAKLHRDAAADPICRRLMSAPGVGPITAVTFRSAVDDPTRFAHSRDVAAHFGLTPVTQQSGRRERRGHISKCGDGAVRTALFLAAYTLMKKNARPSPLRAWGQDISQRRGHSKALVAVARRLAVILHRMWIDETEYLWSVN